MLFKQFLQKNKIIILLGLIILVSLFFRFYNHRDFLHFQLDQSRDSALIKEVYEKSPGELPLLGPRAGGSFLRLGPFYYYLLYLTVVITGSTDPAVFAWPDILSGILLVPLLFFLLSRILSQNWALVTTFLASTSTFLVTYDRFSWNPNMMPFFSALLIFALLKYFENKRKNDRRKSLIWASLLGLIVGLFIQLHFVAFVALPIICGVCFLIFFLKEKLVDKLEHFKLKHFAREILAFLLLFILTQTPIIFNELVSGGMNTQELFQTVGEKQDKDTSHTPLEKIIQNLWVYPKGFWISTTGNISVDYPVWRLKNGFNIMCDLFCRENFATTALSSLYFAGPVLFFLYFFLRKIKEILKRKPDDKKTQKNQAVFELAMISFLWVMIPWWAFYSLSFSLRPRFFLFSVIPFWIIIGLFLNNLSKKRIGKIVAVIIVFLIIFSNWFEILKRFEILKSARVEKREEYPKDLMLFQDETYPVIFKQQEEIASWIRGKYEMEGLVDGKDRIFFWAPSFYYRPIIYILESREMIGKVNYLSSFPNWPKGDYFAVTETGDPKDFFNEKKKGLFDVLETKSFGTLTAYHLELTDQGRKEAIERERQFILSQKFSEKEEARCEKKPKPTCRYNWEDVLKIFSK